MKLILKATVQQALRDVARDEFTYKLGERLFLTLRLEPQKLNIGIGGESYRLPAVLNLDITEVVLERLGLKESLDRGQFLLFPPKIVKSFRASIGQTVTLCLVPGEGGLRCLDKARRRYAMDFRYELPVTFSKDPLMDTLSVPIRKIDAAEPIIIEEDHESWKVVI